MEKLDKVGFDNTQKCNLIEMWVYLSRVVDKARKLVGEMKKRYEFSKEEEGLGQKSPPSHL